MAYFEDDDFLLLSGIQHYAFCRRQWALIHLEGQWADNELTVGGHQLHKRVDDPLFSEKRKDRIFSRSVPIRSTRLGLYGVADLVEFALRAGGVKLTGRSGLWLPRPVEYKFGQTKSDSCDRVQLCAQAMALEEMFAINIESGEVFYGKTRQREEVEFHRQLRDETYRYAQEMHDLMERRVTPSGPVGKHCQKCSLENVCLTKLASRSSVEGYLRKALEDEIPDSLSNGEQL